MDTINNWNNIMKERKVLQVLHFMDNPGKDGCTDYWSLWMLPSITNRQKLNNISV